MTDILFTNFIEKEAQRSGNSVEDVLESMGIEKQDIRVYLTRLDKAHLDSKGKTLGTQDNTSLKEFANAHWSLHSDFGAYCH